jgi:hypothetical protein
MSNHELGYSDCLLAIVDKHTEMRRDTLWYWYICTAWVDLPFNSPMLDYSIDGRIYQAG